MPGVSNDPYDNQKMWKGWIFVLQGQFRGRDGGFMDHTAVARLIRQHGGDVHSRVTDLPKIGKKGAQHVLVTTIKDVVSIRGSNVQKAIQLGRARWRIVQFDYIEDSLPRDTRKDEKKKAVRPVPQCLKYHQIEKALERLGRRAEAVEMYKKQTYGDGVASKAFVDPKMYALYKDTTDFKYKVVLTREIEKTDKRGRNQADSQKERKCFEKYTLMLFESKAQPVIYKLGINHNKPGRPTIHIMDYLGEGEFHTKFKEFKKFFKQKTGIEWDKRLDGITVTSLEKANRKGVSKADGETEAEDKRPFIYTSPPRDQPRGDMPRGWKDRIQIALEKEERAKALRLAAKEAERLAEIEEEKRKVAERKAKAKEMERMAYENGEESNPSECGWDSVGSDSD